MFARDLMTSPVVTCHVNDTLNVAAQWMWDADVGAVIVVQDDGKVASIITDRDICMAAYTQGKSLSELMVSSAMAHTVISAGPDASVGDVEQLMARYQIRRIPIVDAEGMPLGIVSMNDLAVESVQPDTSMKHGPSKIAHTLAAISKPHGAQAAQKAA